MSYKLCSYLPIVILHVCLLYVDNYDEGSGKDTKELFMGLRPKGWENCLGDVE